MDQRDSMWMDSSFLLPLATESVALKLGTRVISSVIQSHVQLVMLGSGWRPKCPGEAGLCSSLCSEFGLPLFCMMVGFPRTNILRSKLAESYCLLVSWSQKSQNITPTSCWLEQPQALPDASGAALVFKTSEGSLESTL